jgi:hypothetical protein
MNKKVYCIKNFKKYFKVNNAYNIKAATDHYIVVCFIEDPDWAFTEVFKREIFENYFMELKEYRKYKINQILK